MNTQHSSSFKSWIAIAIIIVVAGIVYMYMSGGSMSVDTGLLETSISSEASRDVSRTLSLLNQIESLHIDRSIFDSITFRSLQDYSVAIPPQNVGRPNPFAPIR